MNWYKPNGPVYDVTPDPEGGGNPLGAAFRLENSIGAAINYNNLSWQENRMRFDPNFDVVSYAREVGWEGFIPQLTMAKNREHAEIIRSRISQELRDRQTLDESGLWGTVSLLAAGTLDPINLIPVGGGLHLGKTAVSGAKSLGAAFAMGAAYQELPLQALQETRTAEEGIMGVGFATLLGGLIGGAVGKVKSLKPDAIPTLAKEIEQGSVAAESVSKSLMLNLTQMESDVFTPPPIRPAANVYGAMAEQEFGAMDLIAKTKRGVADEPTIRTEPDQPVPVAVEAKVPEEAIPAETVTQPKAQGVVADIEQAFNELSKGKYYERVKIADLRERLPGYSKEELDSALTELRQNRLIHMTPEEDPQELTPRDIASGIQRHEGRLDTWIQFNQLGLDSPSIEPKVLTQKVNETVPPWTVPKEQFDETYGIVKARLDAETGKITIGTAHKNLGGGQNFDNIGLFVGDNSMVKAVNGENLTLDYDPNTMQFVSVRDLDAAKGDLYEATQIAARREGKIQPEPVVYTPLDIEELIDAEIKAVPEPEIAPILEGDEALGAEIKDLFASVPDDAKFGSKVFINRLYDIYNLDYPGLTLEEFKQMLLRLNQKGILKLSRADLVEAMDAFDVKESAIQHPSGQLFNFVRMES